jgi:hypothetical protein
MDATESSTAFMDKTNPLSLNVEKFSAHLNRSVQVHELFLVEITTLALELR